MSELQHVGPARLVQMAAVARRFYVDGRSKSEIGDELGLSRFKVARLIDEARATGLVRIEIGHPGSVDIALSDRLQEAFGLRHAVVLDVLDDGSPAALRAALGQAAAQLLTEIVTADDVLGLAWARSVSAMSAALTRLPPCSVVQLTGALSGALREEDVRDSSIELVREVARVAGGRAAYFYAPMILPDATTAATMRRQPEVARALNLIPSVTIAVAGIGSWGPGLSTVHDAFDTREQDRLRAAGVLVDISGVLLDHGGEPVRTDLTDRMIAITAEQMRAIPELIGIAYGEAKAEAVRVAMTGGFVDGLVTHRELAHALLGGG